MEGLDEGEEIGVLKFSNGQTEVHRKGTYHVSEGQGEGFCARLDIFCSQLSQPKDQDKMFDLCPHMFSLEMLVNTVEQCLRVWLDSQSVIGIIKKFLSLEPYTYFRCHQQNGFHKYDQDWVFLKPEGKISVVRKLPQSNTPQEERELGPGWFEVDKDLELVNSKDESGAGSRVVDVLKRGTFFHVTDVSRTWLEVDIPHPGFIQITRDLHVTWGIELDKLFCSQSDRAFYGLVSTEFVMEQQRIKNEVKRNKIKANYYGLDNIGNRPRGKQISLHREMWPVLVCINKQLVSNPEKGLGWYKVISCTAIRSDVGGEGKRLGLLYPGQKVLVVEKLGRRARVTQPMHGFVSYESETNVKILKPLRTKLRRGETLLQTHFMRHLQGGASLGWYKTLLNTLVRAGVSMDSHRVKVLEIGRKVLVTEDLGRRCKIEKPCVGYLNWESSDGQPILRQVSGRQAEEEKAAADFEIRLPSKRETENVIARLSQTSRLSMSKARRISASTAAYSEGGTDSTAQSFANAIHRVSIGVLSSDGSIDLQALSAEKIADDDTSESDSESDSEDSSDSSSLGGSSSDDEFDNETQRATTPNLFQTASPKKPRHHRKMKLNKVEEDEPESDTPSI